MLDALFTFSNTSPMRCINNCKQLSVSGRSMAARISFSLIFDDINLLYYFKWMWLNRKYRTRVTWRNETVSRCDGVQIDYPDATLMSSSAARALSRKHAFRLRDDDTEDDHDLRDKVTGSESTGDGRRGDDKADDHTVSDTDARYSRNVQPGHVFSYMIICLFLQFFRIFLFL